MLWILVGLFVLGAACGAAIRLLVFTGVLLSAAVIAVGVTAAQGVEKALLMALIAVVALQVGYAAGFVLRAVGRSLFTGTSATVGSKPPITARFGEKRR